MCLSALLLISLPFYLLFWRGIAPLSNVLIRFPPQAARRQRPPLLAHHFASTCSDHVFAGSKSGEFSEQ